MDSQGAQDKQSPNKTPQRRLCSRETTLQQDHALCQEMTAFPVWPRNVSCLMSLGKKKKKLIIIKINKIKKNHCECVGRRKRGLESQRDLSYNTRRNEGSQGEPPGSSGTPSLWDTAEIEVSLLPISQAVLISQSSPSTQWDQSKDIC